MAGVGPRGRERSAALPISFQPSLVEEVVLLLIARYGDEREFRRARDRLYELPEEQRDQRFADLHLQWFEYLGCAAAVSAAIAELPILAERCGRCLVARALLARDEGADLLLAPEIPGAAGRTVSIRLRPQAFRDGGHLRTLLRRELLHVADMLDPEFGYQPRLPAGSGGPSQERVLRERYRVLWEVTVAGRLERCGALGPQTRGESERLFRAAFPMLDGEEADEAFHRFYDDDRPSHARIAAFALAPQGPAAVGLRAGACCPLCRFPTYSAEPSPEKLPDEVVACIVEEFPGWTCGDGLCRQCADLYRARRMSTAAAARLPCRAP